MLEELRITGLGVIEAATLELGPGLTVITGETGAGKTMVVTALGLLLGGRADSGAVRSGSRAARVEGSLRVSALPGVAAAVDAAGGEVEGDHVLLARNVSAEGRSRAFVGGASVPVSQLASVAEPLVAVHGQADQHRLLQPRAQREALDAFGGATIAPLLADYRRLHAELLDTERELTEVGGQRTRAGPGGRPPALRARRDRGGRPGGRRGRHARRGGAAAGPRRHPADGGGVRASGALLRRRRPDALAAVAAARTPPRRRARPRPGRRSPGRPGRRAHLPALRPGRGRRVLRLRARDRPRPAGRRLRAPGRAHRADP